MGSQAKRDSQVREDLGTNSTQGRAGPYGQGFLGEAGPPGQVGTSRAPYQRSAQVWHKPWLAMSPRLSRTPRPGGTPSLHWLCVRLCSAGHPLHSLQEPTPASGANSPRCPRAALAMSSPVHVADRGMSPLVAFPLAGPTHSLHLPTQQRGADPVPACCKPQCPRPLGGPPACSGISTPGRHPLPSHPPLLLRAPW